MEKNSKWNKITNRPHNFGIYKVKLRDDELDSVLETNAGLAGFWNVPLGYTVIAWMDKIDAK